MKFSSFVQQSLSFHYVSDIVTSAPSTAYAVPLPRVERSTSSNHTSLTLVFLGRFPYDLFPNQLRPTDLLLGQVSNGGG